MFGIKPSDYCLHDGASHEISLAPYPEALAVDVKRLRFPLVKPEGKCGGSSDLFLRVLGPLQSGSFVSAKLVAPPLHGLQRESQLINTSK